MTESVEPASDDKLQVAKKLIVRSWAVCRYVALGSCVAILKKVKVIELDGQTVSSNN